MRSVRVKGPTCGFREPFMEDIHSAAKVMLRYLKARFANTAFHKNPRDFTQNR